MNITEKLAAEGHLTPEQVERVGNNVREFLDACDKDPALYKEAIEKVAGLGDAISKLNLGERVPKALALAGAGALLGGAAQVGRSGIRSLQDMYGKSRAYKAMMEENPQFSEADPNLTEKAFDTLYRFNPAYAKDPLVAATFVKNVLDQERLDIGTVSNLVQAHKFMRESTPKSGLPELLMSAMMNTKGS